MLWNFSISLQVSRWCDTHCHETVTENESCLCCAADDCKIGRDELQISHNRLCYNTNYTCVDTVTLVLESRVFFSLSGFSNFHFWFHGFMPTSCIEDDISITNSRLLNISLWQWQERGGVAPIWQFPRAAPVTDLLRYCCKSDKTAGASGAGSLHVLLLLANSFTCAPLTSLRSTHIKCSQ